MEHLATHTSALPRLPTNLKPKNWSNPYADYTVSQMYKFLCNYSLTRDIGVKYEYSNFGMGLLGHALALRTGLSYEDLFIQRVADVMGLYDTRIKLSADMQARLARGHCNGVQVSNWDFPTLAGCGALRSTAHDLLSFLAVNIGFQKSLLDNALKEIRKPRFKIDSVLTMGLGWHILKNNNREIVWHNGRTGGYRSFMGFDKEHKIGVVILTNSTENVDDIGFRLLRGF